MITLILILLTVCVVFVLSVNDASMLILYFNLDKMFVHFVGISIVMFRSLTAEKCSLCFLLNNCLKVQSKSIVCILACVPP